MPSRPHTPSILSTRDRGSIRAPSTFDDDSRYKTMVSFLHGRVVANCWIRPNDDIDATGVLLRRARNNYVTSPSPVSPTLLAAVLKLNVEIAFTMRSATVDAILDSLRDDQTELILSNGSQLQIVDSLQQITVTAVKKFQYACLVVQERMLLVWHDDLQQILPHATYLEERLLSLVWGQNLSAFSMAKTPVDSRANTRPPSIYKADAKVATTAVEVSSDCDEEKLEFNGPESIDRPVKLVSAVFVGAGLCLGIVLLLGFGTSQLVVESLYDDHWERMAFIALTPLLFLIGLFFMIVILTNIFQIFGPIDGITKNSRFYSGVKPDLNRAYASGFRPPHITIQMPVYKEGLEGVIKPTISSLKEAISFYELHGGTASVFVNDDGMQIIPEEEAKARRDFYYDNNIGWVSRPKHNSADGYIRKGKFKKASNMNFALNIAQRVEAYLQAEMDKHIVATGTNLVDDDQLETIYQSCLQRVLKEDPRAQAAGNIRVGEYILIVDSDTRVPVDCLLYGAAEMFLSPEVAIVQHSTGVMQVAHDYFENGITYFTNLVYTTIAFSVGCGEVAPFVGHNGFLRWQAVQSVGVPDPDGYIAYWSESHVSEDFDIALRLQMAGNIVRCANYHNNQFLEGVSLTIFDEFARWEKYAYGCSELVFHPVKYWLTRGPITPLFRTFLSSNMVFSSKMTILAYIASYFALASGFPLSLMNYFIVGWFVDDLDKFYMESWKVFVALIAVFNVFGNVSLAVLRHRLKHKSIGASLLENFKWMPMFSIFFGGLSYHLSAAILAHLLSIDMQWGATAKEKEDSNFWQEIPRIFKTFKWMYVLIAAITGTMIYLGCFAPRGWEINGVTTVVPLAVTLCSHALAPFVLNPSLMIFSY